MKQTHSVFHEAVMEFALDSKLLQHKYIYLCQLEQILGDILLFSLMAENGEDRKLYKPLLSIRQRCIRFARFLSSHEHPRENIPTDEKDHIYRSHRMVMDQMIYLHANPVDNLFLRRLQQLIQDWRMPECSGYDLCDLEVCDLTAQEWLQRYANNLQPPLLIGLRTGGSFFAPFWANRLQSVYKQEKVSYLTLRPIRLNEGEEPHYREEELIFLPKRISEHKDIILIDDQPDTGQTVLKLCQQLEDYYQTTLQIWVTSPGRIFKVRSTTLKMCTNSVPLVPWQTARIWQLLGSNDENKIIRRLQENGVRIDSDLQQLEVLPFGSPFFVRYLNGEPKIRVSDETEQGLFRISPRDSPFVIYNRETQQILFHAKFIGKDLYGDFQFQILQNFRMFLPEPLYYVDGYLVTKYHNGLKSFRDLYAISSNQDRLTLCKKASRYWNLLRSKMGMLKSLSEDPVSLQTKLLSGLNTLSRRLGQQPLVNEAWVKHYIPRSDPRFEQRNTLIRSSLTYSHAFWHWQVDQREDWQVLRFGIDSTWGANIRIDLEIASFLLENRIFPQHAKFICEQIEGISAPEALYLATVGRLPEALYLNVHSWLDRCPHISEKSAENISQDLHDMIAYIEETSW